MRGTKRVRIRFVFTVQHAGPHVKSQCAGIARYGSRPPTSLPISHPPVSPSATPPVSPSATRQYPHQPPASLPISHPPSSRPPTIKQATRQSPHQPLAIKQATHQSPHQPPAIKQATHQSPHQPPASLPISHPPSSRPPASLPISHPPSSRPPARGGPIGINGSPCEGEAGQRPGVAPEAVTEAGVSARQATRKGWPYYIRPLHQRYERFV